MNQGGGDGGDGPCGSTGVALQTGQLQDDHDADGREGVGMRAEGCSENSKQRRGDGDDGAHMVARVWPSKPAKRRTATIMM